MATQTPQSNPSVRLLTTRQLAAYLSVPVSTIYVWRSRGIGPPGFRIGRGLRFRSDDVARWIEERKRAAA